MQQQYKQGDNVRLVDGRVGKIVRVLENVGIYDVRLYGGNEDRFDVFPNEIKCRVKKISVWMDYPLETNEQ